MKNTTTKQFVYIVQAEGTPHFKIGTTADIKARLRSIQTGCPYNVIVRELYEGDKATEDQLHEIFKPFRGYGEWFSLPLNWRDLLPSIVCAKEYKPEPKGHSIEDLKDYALSLADEGKRYTEDDIDKILEIFECEIQRRKSEIKILSLRLQMDVCPDCKDIVKHRQHWLESKQYLKDLPQITESHQIN